MRTIQEFDEAFEKLDQELEAMDGKEFFAARGIDIDSLPSADSQERKKNP